jgi:hypothetical protein
MDTTTVQPVSTRIERGIVLWTTRRDEIRRISDDVYSVPSCTNDDRYTVWTDLKACNCPDHPRAKAQGFRCKHYHAAILAKQHRRELRNLARAEIAKA